MWSKLSLTESIIRIEERQAIVSKKIFANNFIKGLVSLGIHKQL